jgi:hypothetical protein
MTDISRSLSTVDSLIVDVLTDDVSDNDVSKTLFAVSEFANVVRAGAKTISAEVLLCANLGYGLRLVTRSGERRHMLLFDTGPEGAIFLRNCTNLGIALGEVECIAVNHGCAVPLPLILSVGRFQSDWFFVDPANHIDYEHAHHANDGFDALSFASDRPFATDKFQSLLEQLPENIFRAKGVIWLDESESQYVFHLVGQRFTLDESGRRRRSKTNWC